uniref:Group II intron maturase n=1 Tax=Nitella hyalina TaxID=181804 RepID=H9LTH4_NITHY|nr:Group II intron maturase [Nitella hyalina]AEH42860.1 Group II intron maturase [Nitella hyalina]
MHFQNNNLYRVFFQKQVYQSILKNSFQNEVKIHKIIQLMKTQHWSALSLEERYIISQVIEMIVDAIYELPSSRAGPHKALRKVRNWKNTKWLVKGEAQCISGALLSRIKDQKFLDLIAFLIKRDAKMLSKIILPELDIQLNEVCKASQNKIQTLIQARKTERLSYFCSDFIIEQVRVYYVRYDKHWILGVNGPYCLAKEICNLVHDICINLRISSKIELGDKVKFLSTLISLGKTNITMEAPISDIIKNLSRSGFCDQAGKPHAKLSWVNLDIAKILQKFNQIGVCNYSSFVHNRTKLRRIQYIIQYSAMATLGRKLKLNSAAKVFKRFSFCNGKWHRRKSKRREKKRGIMQ